MEKEIKCSLKKHSKNNAITFCKECNKYMCNKCNQSHSDLFDDHSLISIEELKKNNFTSICKEENHNLELEYFCKTHNILCCERCISKFKQKGNGKHSNCNISPLEKIKDTKRNILKENIKYLNKLTKNVNLEIEELKNIIEKTEEEKEKLKTKIQKIFTQIRSSINEREDQLLLYVDKKYDKFFIKKELHKEGMDLPKIIKTNLEKATLIDKDWEKNKLSFLINDCTNIENSITKIKEINKKLKSINNNIKINFFPNDYEVNQLSNSLKCFGKISHKEYKYAFKECPKEIEENKKYIVSGLDNNILTKVGKNCWTGIMCKNPFERNKKHIYKIKILESHKESNSIIIGVAPENFDINKSTYTDCGWYLCCCCGHLFSGGPHNYKDKKIDNKFNLKSKVITLIMDMNSGSLKYIIDSEKAIEIYSNLPIDKPLFPVVFLKYKDDKVIVSDNNWRQISDKKSSRKQKDKKDKQNIIKENVKKDIKEKEKREYNNDEQDYDFRRGHRYVGRFRFIRRINFNRGFRRFGYGRVFRK